MEYVFEKELHLLLLMELQGGRGRVHKMHYYHTRDLSSTPEPHVWLRLGNKL